MKIENVVKLMIMLSFPVTGVVGSEHTPDPRIKATILEVNGSNILATAVDLEQMVSRKTGQPGNTNAAAYLVQRLNNIPGIKVEYQDSKLKNVMATLQGTDVDSEKIYMAGAHYDSTSNIATNAPGATDDAAGVGSVLELARVMSRHKYKHTLIFAFWNAEEQGLKGSQSFVAEARSESKKIALYINFDSICFDPYNRMTLDVMSNKKSQRFRDILVRNNELYEIGFKLKFNQHKCRGDHIPFWKNGYPALSTHQEKHGAHYHTANDCSRFISVDYVSSNAKLGLTMLSELAIIE